MLRRFLLLLAAALLALVGARASQAERAVHFNDVIDVSETFDAQFLDEQCGFDVTVTLSGSLDVTLFYNDAGLVEREIDTFGGGTTTFSSPYGSFSIPMALTQEFIYPGGATLGSTATVRNHGLFGHVPGFIASDAGLEIIMNAVVVGFSPEGIPDVDGTGSVFIEHGNRESGEDIVNAICAALSPAR